MKAKWIMALIGATLVFSLSSCSRSREKTDFDTAVKSRNVKQMQAFIDKYPEGQYAMDMKKEMEQTAWDNCSTVFDYADFADSYPQSEVADAEKLQNAVDIVHKITRTLSPDDIQDVLATVATTPPTPVGPNETATIETPFGKMTVRFFTDKAPNHAANFKRLAEAGYFNGTTFHRIIPGFVIQGGDINSRDADRSNDGTGGPGYTVNAEFNDIHHRMGILSMARARDINSAGSQFFICAGDVGQLDHQYTVFGEVVDGLEVIEKIVNQKRDGRDNPVTSIPMYVYMNKN